MKKSKMNTVWFQDVSLVNTSKEAEKQIRDTFRMRP